MVTAHRSKHRRRRPQPPHRQPDRGILVCLAAVKRGSEIQGIFGLQNDYRRRLAGLPLANPYRKPRSVSDYPAGASNPSHPPGRAPGLPKARSRSPGAVPATVWSCHRRIGHRHRQNIHHTGRSEGTRSYPDSHLPESGHSFVDQSRQTPRDELLRHQLREGPHRKYRLRQVGRSQRTRQRREVRLEPPGSHAHL